MKNVIYDLEVGDCVLVSRGMIDRITGKDYTWRFLGIVTEIRPRSYAAVLYRLAPSKDGDHEFNLFLGDSKNKVVKIDPENWPDGVHQVRMQLILTGQIDI